MIDRHKRFCTCTYCSGKTKLHYGLNIPKDWKSRNSWWVIKITPYTYIRWTNHWFSRFSKPLWPSPFGKYVVIWGWCEKLGRRVELSRILQEKK